MADRATDLRAEAAAIERVILAFDWATYGTDLIEGTEQERADTAHLLASAIVVDRYGGGW